jgi:hypothetical protein
MSTTFLPVRGLEKLLIRKAIRAMLVSKTKIAKTFLTEHQNLMFKGTISAPLPVLVKGIWR